jgi:type II secretory pathway pseudopilin PulG
MLSYHRQSRVGLRARSGFTMLEFLVVFTMLGVIGGAVTMVLMRQQRFYNNNSALIESRAQVRQAINVMPMDIWSVSSVGGDIYAMTDSSIDIRAITGSSVLCATKQKEQYISLPPVRIAKHILTSWVNEPVAGDSVLVYDDSTSSATARDDAWRVYSVTTVTKVTGDFADGCPVGSGYTQPTDLVTGNPSYKLTLGQKQGKYLRSGAPIRIFRRVHYSLFKDTDNKWYLGYYDCLPGRTPLCNPIQAVSGPFLPYALPSAGTSGLTFTYYDSLNVVTADPTKVARINVVVRSAPDFASKLGEYATNTFRDSLRFDIALRNRK